MIMPGIHQFLFHTILDLFNTDFLNIFRNELLDHLFCQCFHINGLFYRLRGLVERIGNPFPIKHDQCQIPLPDSHFLFVFSVFRFCFSSSI